MSPFVRMLFQGEEWAASSPFQYFVDHEDRDMARLVREGRREESAAFGWAAESIPDPENRETFERSKLMWEERNAGEHRGMPEWHRASIRLRQITPTLQNREPGRTRVVFNEREMTFSMQRGDVTLCCNLGNTDRRFCVHEGSQIDLSSTAPTPVEEGSIVLQPDTVVILKSSNTVQTSSWHRSP